MSVPLTLLCLLGLLEREPRLLISAAAVAVGVARVSSPVAASRWRSAAG